MKFNVLKAAIAGLVLSISCITNAGIIDNGDYTTVDGLDWLDWTLTLNLTQTEALSDNIDWRTATSYEMKAMMSEFFNHPLIWGINGSAENSGEVADLAAYQIIFSELFGITAGTFGSTYAHVEGVGIVGHGGYDAGGLLAGFENPRSDYTGVALVRNSTESRDVPEPSALAIFALGMFGLVSRRIKRNYQRV
jgi:hypothetical protein